MACPSVLNPTSQTNRCVLPATGTIISVNDGVSFGIYSDPTSDLYSTDFLSGAAEQVNYTYNLLGGNVLDIEIKAANVYSCYESAVLEYSQIINAHQAENSLSDMLGSATGSFDADGNLKDGELKTTLDGTHVSLKFPKYDFSYAKQVSNRFSTEANVGGTEPIYSASFDIVAGVQDYDLQTIVSAAADTATNPFYGKVGDKRITVRKVYWKSPFAMWRFYRYGGLSVIGDMVNYGQYSDNHVQEVVPVWENRLQAQAYEDALYVRTSHYSFEVKNNQLRLFPAPLQSGPTKFWIQFTVPTSPFEDDSATGNSGVDGVNNINTAPFGNIPFENINGIGKHWIRRYSLSCTKAILAQVRGKFQTLPIPGNEVTLNHSQLLDQAEKEMTALKEELQALLDKLTYQKLSERDAAVADTVMATLNKIPMPIYVG